MDTGMLSENELDDRLHRANPVIRVSLDDEGVGAALAAMRNGIESSAPRPAGPLGRRPAQRRRWAVLGTAVAAVAVASLVGVATLTGGGGGAGLPLAVPPAAAAQLTRIAHATAGQAGPSAGQWDYLALKVENTFTASAGSATVACTDSVTWQEWDGPHGDTRQRETANGFSFLAPQDRATYLADPTAFDGQIDRFVGSWNGGHGPTFTGQVSDAMHPGATPPQPAWETTSPPTDPQTLITDVWSLQTAGDSPRSLPSVDADRPALLFGDLFNLLVNSNSAQLRATAYAALAYVPGTQVLGNETDQLGRAGIAISFAYHGVDGNADDDERIIVSPSTGDLLEEDGLSTSASHDLPVGTPVQREIFLQSGVVGSDTALPGGGTQPYEASTPAAPTQTSTTQGR